MKNKLKSVLIIAAILLVVYGVWRSYDRFFSYAGVANAITIEVQNVEVSERYGEHTIVWARAREGRTYRSRGRTGRGQFSCSSTVFNRIEVR